TPPASGYRAPSAANDAASGTDSATSANQASRDAGPATWAPSAGNAMTPVPSTAPVVSAAPWATDSPRGRCTVDTTASVRAISDVRGPRAPAKRLPRRRGSFSAPTPARQSANPALALLAARFDRTCGYAPSSEAVWPVRKPGKDVDMRSVGR